MYINSGQLYEFTFDTPVGKITLQAPQYAKFVQSADEIKTYEPSTASEVHSVLIPETVPYGVGSRYGYFMMIAKQSGVSAERIHGFEANKCCYRVMKRNIAEQSHTTRAFVGDETSGGVLSIDDYIRAHRPPDTVKMDIEGAEYGVLKGMIKMIQMHKPELYLKSIHPQFLENTPIFWRTFLTCWMRLTTAST